LQSGRFLLDRFHGTRFGFFDTRSDDENLVAGFQLLPDGFRLAELDLKQRGFGSLFGTEQTGWEFRFSRFLTVNALKLGQQAAEAMLKTDKNLRNHPQLRKLVEPLLEQIHLE
jgi:RecG-like helicase